MSEEDINIARFSKTDLLETQERLFLGYYMSCIDEGVEAEVKNEVVLNYLAIKKIIKQSKAS